MVDQEAGRHHLTLFQTAALIGGTVAVGIALNGCTPTETSKLSTPTVPPPANPNQEQNSTQLPNLGLKIDANRWGNLVQSPAKWGVIPKGKDNSDCPALTKGICLVSRSSIATYAINGPMLVFMNTTTGLENPAISTQIIIADDWIPISLTHQDTDAATIYYDEGTKQDIIFSTNRIAFSSFKTLEGANIPLERDQFQGDFSYRLSRAFAHEAAHAGREIKILLGKGFNIMDKFIRERMHPQINSFQTKYEELYDQAGKKGRQESALILAADFGSFDLDAYRARLYAEAIQLGITQ